MTWYLVTWLAWTCPGGWLGQLAIPAAARPLVCQAKPQRLITSYREQARRQVREAGPGAVLERCRGLRCESEDVIWRTIVEFED